MLTNDQILSGVLRDFQKNNPGLNPLDPRWQPHIQSDIAQAIADNDQIVEAQAHYSQFMPAPAPPSVGQNFSTAFSAGGQGRLTTAYGAMEVIGGASSAYAAQNRGAYLTPEETTSSNLAILPGIGAIAGGIIGSAVPGGTVPGAMIGGGIASAAQTGATAQLERGQEERQTSEQFAAAIGAATDKIHSFSAAIEASGVAAQSLQTVMSTLSGVGPNTTQTIAGATGFARALGEYAPAQSSVVASQLRDPLLSTLSNKLGSKGNLSGREYDELAIQASLTGDPATAHAELLNAGRMRNPALTEAERLKGQIDAKGFSGFVDRTWSSIHHEYSWNNTDKYKGKEYDTWAAATDAYIKDVEAGNSPDPTADVVNRNLAHNATMGGMLLGAEASSGRAQSSFSRTSATGTAAEIAKNLTSALAAQNSLSTTSVALAQTYRDAANDPANAAIRDSLLAKANITEQGGYAAQSTAISEQSTSSIATVSQAQSSMNLALTRARIGGASETSLQSVVDKYATTERGVANRPRSETGLSVDQQNALLSDAAESVYGQRMAGYAQTESGIGANIAKAGIGVAQERATGTPVSLYKAQNEEIYNQITLEKQLNTEIDSGTLKMGDRLNKQKEVAALAATITQSEHQRNIEYTSNTVQLAQSTAATEEVYSNRAVRLGGGTAFNTDILDQLRTSRDKNLAASMDTRDYTENERREFRRRAANDDNDIWQQTESAHASYMTPGLSSALTTAQANVQISQAAPFVGYLASNPYNRNSQLIKVEQQAMAAAQSQLRADAIADKGNPGQFAIDYQNLNPEIQGYKVAIAQQQTAKWTAEEMSFASLHEGESPQSRAIASGGQARAAFFNPNFRLSGTFTSTKPDSSYDFSPIGNNYPAGFAMAAAADKNAAPVSARDIAGPIVDAITQGFANVFGRGWSPAQMQKPNSPVNRVSHAINQRGMPVTN
jgi:hypothetical protein